MVVGVAAPAAEAATASRAADPEIDLGIGGWVASWINDWFGTLVILALKPLLNLLAATLLTTPDLTTGGRIFDLWATSATLANAGFTVLLTLGAIIAMGHQTVQTRYAVKEVLPRLALAFLAANTSFLTTGKVIEVANATSTALLGQGFDASRAVLTLQFLILPRDNREIFYILLGLVSVILLILLLITFVLRTALVLLLVIAAPLALAGLALPATDGLARFWWRAFTGLLLIQVAQSLTLVTAVRIFFNQDGRLLLGIAPSGPLVNLLLALCLLIILVRIPTWISRQIFAATRGRSSTIVRIVKYALLHKLTSPVLGALHLGRRGGSGGGRAAFTAKGAAASALTGRLLPALAAGPAGTAAASAMTAASAARGGGGPVKHAPVAARRPIRAEDWEPGPVKHAPSAPPVRGKYRPAPKPPAPVPQSAPVFGYPRETRYADGPAGLAQMYRLRAQASTPPSRGTVQPPPVVQRPVRPIVAPDTPVPGSVDWPENPGARRTPPPSRRRSRDRRSEGEGR
ncbi:conjugal transfer protein TrbL family protein [Planobispora takensis]|uniref:conjugal transfer protein TrbL family protein n=1 Tax=Planobispora takensis TaxID=1367882 RepID=UPI00194247B3|nr:conjugal transfer protein TrbL family protein [Planobispora takensis]